MAAYIASQITRSLEESLCFSLSCFILASIEYYCSASFFCALAKCSIVFVVFFRNHKEASHDKSDMLFFNHINQIDRTDCSTSYSNNITEFMIESSSDFTTVQI